MKNIDNVYIKDIFTQYIDLKKIKTIFEVGAMECDYTQEIIDYYTYCEDIHIFECNPYTTDRCNNNINKLKRNNRFIKKVVFNNIGLSSQVEQLKFYPVLNSDNVYGSSSVGFIPTEQIHNLITHKECIIDCTTIDNYCLQEKIQTIDLLLIDIEGSELKALQGATKMLPTVSNIILETQDVRRYENTPLRCEIKEFLYDYGFNELFTTCDGYFGDSIFGK